MHSIAGIDSEDVERPRDHTENQCRADGKVIPSQLTVEASSKNPDGGTKNRQRGKNRDKYHDVAPSIIIAMDHNIVNREEAPDDDGQQGRQLSHNKYANSHPLQPVGTKLFIRYQLESYQAACNP